MYDGLVIEIPMGRAGMTSRPNRLLSGVDELLTARDTTMEDSLLRKAAGAVLYDATGLAGAPVLRATLSGTTDWIGKVAYALDSGGASAHEATLTGAASNAAGTTLTITNNTGSATTAGALLVVTIGYVNVTGSEVVSIVDNTSGTVYTFPILSPVSGGADLSFLQLETFVLRPAAIPNLGTLTVNFNTSGLVRGVQASTYVNLDTSVYNGNSAAAHSTAVAVPSDSLSGVPAIVFGGGVSIDGSITVAAAGGFTKVTAGSENSGSAGTDIRVWQEYKRFTSLLTIIAAHDWWPTSTAQRLVTAALDGSLYKDDGAGNLDATTLKTGLSTSARPGRFVSAGIEVGGNDRKLFYFNGSDVVQVLKANGAATADIATPPADWTGTNQPLNAIVHLNRLAAFGVPNAPHTVYVSDGENHENFTSTDSFLLQINSGVGDRLYGAAQYQGVLHFWKWPRGIFYIDDSDLVGGNWQPRVKSTGIGCAASPYAVLPIDDDVMFMAADGNLHLLSAVNTLGGTRSSNVTYALGLSQWFRDNLNLSRLSQVTSAWYPHKKLALWGVPGVGSTTNNLVLLFDFGAVQEGGPVKFHYWSTYTADAFAARRDTDTIERPVLGSGGYIYQLDQSTRSIAGVGYSALFQTPHLDMSHVDPRNRRVRKQYDFLEFVMDPSDAGTLTVAVIVDGTERQTLTVDTTLYRQRFKLNAGDGHTFSLQVTSSDAAGDDFKLLAVLLYFKQTNEDTKLAFV
jgi:hypothetical protein